jgi:hypothetical protein
MKNKKLLVRILAGILLLVMVLGLVIPYVSAVELDNTNTAEIDVPQPDSGLPIGFEYKFNGATWDVVKSEGNTKPAIMIDTKPDSCDVREAVVFIGNLATHEVKYYNLYRGLNYVSSVDLDDGYYVIFTNNYAWEDSRGDVYAINGGEYQYIYIGDNYDPTLYGVQFDQTSGIFSLSLKDAKDDSHVMSYDTALLVTNQLLVLPSDASPEAHVPTQPTQEPTPQPTTPKPDNPAKEDEPDSGFFADTLSMLGRVMKKSAFLLICIAGCFIGLKVIQIKKKIKTEKQTENDKYDDRRID